MALTFLDRIPYPARVHGRWQFATGSDYREYRRQTERVIEINKEIAVARERTLLAVLDDYDFDPDDLKLAEGWDVYDRMLNDEQVSLVVNLGKAATLSTGYSVVPASDDPRHQMHADFIEYAFEQMVGTLTDVMWRQLNAVHHGFQITEINLARYDRGPFAGKYGLASLKDRPFRTFRFKTDVYGNLGPKGLLQFQDGLGGLGTPVPLTTRKFIITVHDPESGNYYGNSALRPAFRPFNAKAEVTKHWVVALFKFAMPSMILKHPGMADSKVAKALDYLENLTNASAGAIPDTMEIELMQSIKSGKAEFQGAVEYFNKAIAKALLVPHLLLDEGVRAGSFAQSQTQYNAFTWVLRRRQQMIEEALNPQLVCRLVDWNFPDVDAYPRVVLNEFTEDDIAAIGELIWKAIELGVVHKGEAWIRERLGFDPFDEDAIVLLPPDDGGDGKEDGGEAPPKNSPDPDARGGNPRNTGKPSADPEEDGPSRADNDRHEHATISGEPTIYSRKVDFVRLGSELDSVEDQATRELSGAFESARADLLAKIRSGGVPDHKEIGSIKVGRASLIRNKLVALAGAGVMYGVLHAQEEIAKTAPRGKAPTPRGFSRASVKSFRLSPALERVVSQFEGKVPIPRELLEAYDRHIFTITGNLTTELASEAQTIISRGIINGTPVRTLEGQLAQLFEPYVIAGEVDIALTQALRLNTIVRTNLIEAMNTGRMAYFEDPGIVDAIVGYEYSAILDGRTTPICQRWNGVRIPRDHPRKSEIVPPNHYNCRSLLSAITRWEQVTFTPEAKIASLPSPPKGFLAELFELAEIGA